MHCDDIFDSSTIYQFEYKIHCYYGTTIPAANFRLCYAYGATGQILFSEPGLFSKLTVLRNFRIL